MIYDESKTIGKSLMSSADKYFVQRLRNLVINVLLALEFSPSLLTDIDRNEVNSQTKGFGIKLESRPSSNIRYPRWLGKNYSHQSVFSAEHCTHSNPCIHWRRGHWRVLESGENKRWKENKRIWIEPVLVNS